MNNIFRNGRICLRRIRREVVCVTQCKVKIKDKIHLLLIDISNWIHVVDYPVGSLVDTSQDLGPTANPASYLLRCVHDLDTRELLK